MHEWNKGPYPYLVVNRSGKRVWQNQTAFHTFKYGSNNVKDLLNLNKYWKEFNGIHKSFCKKYNYRWVVINLF